MPRFVITETVINYFVVDAESEYEAFDKVAYRDPVTMNPDEVDIIGYENVEQGSPEDSGFAAYLLRKD